MRLFCLLLAFSAALPSQDRRVQPIVARKSVALVIGNTAYANRPLQNAANDARAVAARFRQLDFDTTLVTDAGRRAMGQAIDRFIGKLGTGDVAVLYYSGHGMQVDGENYLIPTDFQGRDETDVHYDAYPAGKIQERMERSGSQLNILVLDACRDNPFRSAARGGMQGLAAPSAGVGTFVALATAPGRTASDNPKGANGLFTSYLLEALATPGLGLNDLFDYVRERVVADTRGQQVPWTLSSVVGRYIFVPGNEPARQDVRPTAGTSAGALDPAVQRLLDRWIATTQSGDIPNHLALYEDRVSVFYSKRDLTREDLRGEFTDMFKTYSGFPDMKLSAITSSVMGAGIMQLQFDKDFRAIKRRGGSYSGRVHSELTLRGTSGAWRIVGERDTRVYWTRQDR